VVVSPATHVVGEIEEIDGCAHTQSFCAWQNAGEISNKSSKKSVAARGNGP
jgi:hypothetical protein